MLHSSKISIFPPNLLIYVFFVTNAHRMATTANQAAVATGSEGLTCFVCDVGVVGRYYALATCRTQASKIRLIEKLGQLVGDE